MTSKEYIKHIVLKGTPAEKRELFSFDENTSDDRIVKKFKIFSRSLFVRYFTHPSAPFHDETIRNMVSSYVHGENVIEIAFRGAAKTALLKLFVVFVILCDRSKRKKYIKILSKDGKNSRQIVTDIYNLIIETRDLFGDVFEKQDDKKRETTMASFTLKDGRKLASGTVGQTQRGHLQDAYRPDWVLFEDIEDRETVSSAVQTHGIIEHLDEALTGLSIDGNWYANANYISDTGAVEWLKTRASREHITPILDAEGKPTWNVFTPQMIEELKGRTNDWFGEYMCDPNRAVDKFFDVARIERDMAQCREPQDIVGNVKYWAKYEPNHAYGLGSDHAEGIGRDSNTMALFDFNTGMLVATQASNMIAPDLHAHECLRVSKEYGKCVWAPETNNRCGGIVLQVAQSNGANLYKQVRENIPGMPSRTIVGWDTNKNTKTAAFMQFRSDYNDGLVHIFDIEVLKEMKAYTNNDLTDTDTGLITRHFDSLMAVVIAWATRKAAVRSDTYDTYDTMYVNSSNNPVGNV